MDPNKLLTQNITPTSYPLGRIGGEGLGPFGNMPLDATTALQGIIRTISSVIGLLTIAASIWFLLQITIAGLNWISAEGDAKKLESARRRITSAMIGLIIVVSGVVILSLASKFLGYDLLLSSPKDIIDKLQIKP
jgi:hypothetical protein